MSKTASKSMHNWRRSNWYEIDQKNAVLNLALCCGAIWRQREKPQYRCTTTIHSACNCSKKILENLHPVWLLVRTNLFIPSCFWTTEGRKQSIKRAINHIDYDQFSLNNCEIVTKQLVKQWAFMLVHYIRMENRLSKEEIIQLLNSQQLIFDISW